MTATDDTIIGTFEWIPASENGPTMPSARPKWSGFAYVDPHRDVEGAILLRGQLPEAGTVAGVEAIWLPGYPVPTTRVGDVVVLVASQRPIARLTVTGVREAARVGSG